MSANCKNTTEGFKAIYNLQFYKNQKKWNLGHENKKKETNLLYDRVVLRKSKKSHGKAQPHVKPEPHEEALPDMESPPQVGPLFNAAFMDKAAYLASKEECSSECCPGLVEPAQLRGEMDSLADDTSTPAFDVHHWLEVGEASRYNIDEPSTSHGGWPPATQEKILSGFMGPIKERSSEYLSELEPLTGELDFVADDINKSVNDYHHWPEASRYNIDEPSTSHGGWPPATQEKILSGFMGPRNECSSNYFKSKSELEQLTGELDSLIDDINISVNDDHHWPEDHYQPVPGTSNGGESSTSYSGRPLLTQENSSECSDEAMCEVASDAATDGGLRSNDTSNLECESALWDISAGSAASFIRGAKLTAHSSEPDLQAFTECSCMVENRLLPRLPLHELSSRLANHAAVVKKLIRELRARQTDKQRSSNNTLANMSDLRLTDHAQSSVPQAPLPQHPL